jgi:hypothetical protein
MARCAADQDSASPPAVEVHQPVRQVVLCCALPAPNRTHGNSKSSRNSAVLVVKGRPAIYRANFMPVGAGAIGSGKFSRLHAQLPNMNDSMSFE